MSEQDFVGFPKIARLSRECIVTEKIDGTNAQVYIEEDGATMHVGSRSRWLRPGEGDNFGFRAWVEAHREELLQLGPGRHFGEWWGKGIQRGYGLDHKRFSLFNVSRWTDDVRPACCHVVPVLFRGSFDDIGLAVEGIFRRFAALGSSAAPGFPTPEGIVVYHVAGNLYFKKTMVKDESPKGVEA
jgi:hypothetical protein